MAAGYDDSEEEGKMLTRHSLGWNSSPSNGHVIGQAGRFEGGVELRGAVPSNPVLAQIVFERSLTEPHGNPRSETGRMCLVCLYGGLWVAHPAVFQSQDCLTRGSWEETSLTGLLAVEMAAA